MKVEINRHITEVAPSTVTLGELLSAECLDGPGRAVAVDGNLVRRSEWNTTLLREGMKITVISAVCGG